MKILKTLTWLCLITLSIFSSQSDALAWGIYPKDPLTWGWSHFLPPKEGDMRAWQVPQEPKNFSELIYVDEWMTERFLSESEGGFVLLNFWATWCAPCVAELPSLDVLQQKMYGRNLEVLAYSLNQGQADQVSNFYAENGIENLDVAVEIRDASQYVEMPGLPTTVLLDPYGNEVGRLEGPADWSSPEVLALLDYYLELWDSLTEQRIAVCKKEKEEEYDDSDEPCL